MNIESSQKFYFLWSELPEFQLVYLRDILK